jgi:hypothetical protein
VVKQISEPCVGKPFTARFECYNPEKFSILRGGNNRGRVDRFAKEALTAMSGAKKRAQFLAKSLPIV